MSSSTLLRQIPLTHQCRRAAIARYYSSTSPANSIASASGSSLASRRTSESSSPRNPSAPPKTQLWAKRNFGTTSARRSTTHPEPLEVNLTEGEDAIHQKLTERFKPSQLKVQDVSGGCGTFYGILISSKEFAGKSIVQQHKLVQETIKEEIEGIHGLQIKTIAE